MDTIRNALRLAAFYVIAAACAAHGLSAHAGQHVYRTDHPAYAQECGSCHVPYPPALLAAPSWTAVMGGLDRHFGTDASLEPAARADILSFLGKNAGRRDTSADGRPLLRVSETAWFLKEHRKEVPAGALQRPDVKSFANCGACHEGAQRGDYSERGIRVPGGRGR